ncbi:uncharacterized protein LOC124462503 [Hypomesus transpacificus]|uniref:uncharacterized protein LOC124462503 n=1 Tax=Hypomesus transpacificus TaxID=137520 RepID=UPI001F076A02|nr:uncharacterized protein LOC124462503 [Hypomesus transpacificus]
MGQVWMRRWFSLDNPIQVKQMRLTRAKRKPVTMMCWMPLCPTSLSPVTKPPPITLQPLRMPAVKTLFLVSRSWKRSALLEIGLIDTKLSLTTEQRNELLQLWNTVEEHDKRPQQFTQLHRTHWGNTLYCRTKRDDLVDAAVIQKLKMVKRYAPAQQDISALHNRLMYTLVKLLWLRSPQGSCSSPEKTTILKAYEWIQQ